MVLASKCRAGWTVAVGRKTGGRKAGTPNKRTVALTAALADRLEALDFCPVEALIRVGQAAEAAGELDLARAAFADVAPFVYPRKKAVEHGGGLGLEQLVTYSVVTGVPRAPNDPLPDGPAAPAPRPPERIEAPSPVVYTPEPPRTPAPAVSAHAPPVVRRFTPATLPLHARDVPAGPSLATHEYDPFAGF